MVILLFSIVTINYSINGNNIIFFHEINTIYHTLIIQKRSLKSPPRVGFTSKGISTVPNGAHMPPAACGGCEGNCKSPDPIEPDFLIKNSSGTAESL
jgi:hypothetical protein